MQSDEQLTGRIIGLAIEVHKALGPGLLESAYEACLALELRASGLQYERQALLPVTYKGMNIGNGYRMDLVVEKRVIVEVKSVEHILPVHQAQLLTYLRLSGIPARSAALILHVSTPPVHFRFTPHAQAH